LPTSTKIRCILQSCSRIKTDYGGSTISFNEEWLQAKS
jgi:hypothetical protein